MPCNRVVNLTEDRIDQWFNVLKKAKEELGKFDVAQNIWNCDEIGLYGNVENDKIICRKGSRNPHTLIGSSEHVLRTVLHFGNAAGNVGPTFIIYAAKKIWDSWCMNGPEGCCYGVSKTGWMVEELFTNWFIKCFVPFVKTISPGKHLLIFDGHASHIGIKTINYAVQNDIVLLTIPSHSSHILQPLDVGVYAPYKRAWRSILKSYYRDSNFKTVDNEHFPLLVQKLLITALQAQHFIGGFRECGIHPYNRSKITVDKLSSSIIFKAPNSDPISQDMFPNNNLCEHQTSVSESCEKLSEALLSALMNNTKNYSVNKRKRRYLSGVYGEVLTSAEIREKIAEYANVALPKKPFLCQNTKLCKKVKRARNYLTNKKPYLQQNKFKIRTVLHKEILKPVSSFPLHDKKSVRPLRYSYKDSSKSSNMSDDNLSFKVIPIKRDGNCLFGCFSKTIYGNEDQRNVSKVRQSAVNYVVQYWNSGRRFKDFIGVHNVTTPYDYQQLMNKNSVYGDNPEVTALSDFYKRCVKIYSGSTFNYHNDSVYNERYSSLGVIYLHFHESHYDLLQPTNI